MLRVGLIGLGQISNENVLGYLNSPDAKIVAVCSLNKAGAKKWLKRWRLSGVRWYEDYRAMLGCENLDLVEVLTPHHLHCEQAIACANARVKGISLQKPMAITLSECERIIEACRQNGVILKVYENFVFYPVYIKAKELIQQGLIGDLVSIRINTMVGLRAGAPLPWCFNPDAWRADLNASGVGPLVGDDGFHKFSLARWFMERDFEKVSAWIDSETLLDAPAFVRAKFRRQPGDGPKYAQIDFSFSPRMNLPCDFWLDEFVEIIGEKGIMWINQCSAAGDRKMFQGNQMSNSPVFPPIAVFIDGEVKTFLSDISPQERNWSSSFLASTKHFIQVLRDGGSPIYTGEDGMEVTRYAIAAHVSAETNCDVRLDEITAEAEREKRFEIKRNFCNYKAKGNHDGNGHAKLRNEQTARTRRSNNPFQKKTRIPPTVAHSRTPRKAAKARASK
jgi:predicted dehydrogenase